MRIILWIILFFVFHSSSASAEGMMSAKINNKYFYVKGDMGTGFAFIFNGYALLPNDNNATASIDNILSWNNNFYVVVVENGGGSASANQYRIVDVSSDTPTMSDLMGDDTSDILTEGWKADDDGVSGEFSSLQGDWKMRCSFRSAKTLCKKFSSTNVLYGPDTPPGGDYEIFANKKPISFAFKSKSLSSKIRYILPSDIYSQASEIAYSDEVDVFQENHGVVSAKSHQRYDETRWFSVAFDRDGNAYAAFSPGNGTIQYYGKPDELIKLAL